ncbi:MAG: glycosyltransferase WbuB, partial [Aldersonia sp.]|nr:glycosyltransferase WbuB [Aldersonia sp.]
MRVKIVGINYAPETTGIAPYTSGLADGLAARGHRVEVLTGQPHYPQWRR